MGCNAYKTYIMYDTGTPTYYEIYSKGHSIEKLNRLGSEA